jgi:hypothetical protein
MEYSEIILQLNNWYVKNFIFFPIIFFKFSMISYALQSCWKICEIVL